MAHVRLAHPGNIVIDHLFDEAVEAHAMPPAERLPRLAGIADQEIDLGRTEIARIDLDQHAVRARFDTFLIHTFAAPF